MSNRDEYNEYYFTDDPELRDLIEERRKRNDQMIREKDAQQKIINQTLRNLDKKEIREKSITPTQDIIRKYPEDVMEELNEHENKRVRNPGMSSMWEIPLPNVSRQYLETPYELKSKPNEFGRRYVKYPSDTLKNRDRTRTMRRGGVKKRMTKKGKNKKKKKKQRRRTNKKRYKRKV